MSVSKEAAGESADRLREELGSLLLSLGKRSEVVDFVRSCHWFGEEEFFG